MIFINNFIFPRESFYCSFFCWEKSQLERQCCYSKQQKRICFYEIVTMPLQYFCVYFQTVKLQKYSPWEKQSFLSFSRWVGIIAGKVIVPKCFQFRIMKQQPISNRKWISFFIFWMKILTTLLQNIWDRFPLAEQHRLTILAC